ncbi:MAG: cysteine desulfurase family protein [Verrucomicrobiota bacterium]
MDASEAYDWKSAIQQVGNPRYVCYLSGVRTIYFDYNATTPLDPAVREAMLPYLGEVYGNPSSVHHVGRRARALLDDARDRLAKVWKSKPSEVIFTSGGTESNNLALFGAARLLQSKGRHIITSPVEHHAVLHSCQALARQGFEVTYLPVDSFGRVDPAGLKRALRPDTILVSVMAANNETGTLQPVAELGALCRERGVLFHTDAVQWFGKEPFADIHQFNADLVSACAHKFHGPKGSGALFIRSPLLPEPILFGGGHENERRAGTENLASIIGFVEAFERFVPRPVFDSKEMLSLTHHLEALSSRVSGLFLKSPPQRLSNTVSFTVEGCDSIALLAGLDMEGICASSGSACSAGSLEPSHVLLAMGVPKDEANSLVRFSLGRESTSDEVSVLEQSLPVVINRIRNR